MCKIKRMKLHRFFITPSLIHGKEIVSSDKELINQLKNVLRLKNGDEILFLDGSGKEYQAAIEELHAKLLRARIVETRDNQNEPEIQITLCQALCKKDKFELVLQKGTEVGISFFVPLVTERTEKTGLNAERAEKILKEAAEQSERGIIPKLLQIQKFEEVVKDIESEKIILDKSGESIKYQASGITYQALSIFVGPEGGWTEQELKVAKENGAKIISLGSRVLRTETAGMIVAAILLNR